MKKLFFILALSGGILNTTSSQPKKDFVLVGQLYGTQTFGFFDKLKGQVMEVRQTNWLARKENGKFVKVRKLTTEDRILYPSGKDYFEEYNTSGTLLKDGVMDENGQLVEYWDVDADSGRILSAAYYTNDILRANIMTKYNGSNLEEIIYVYPGTDMMMKRVIISYDGNGNRTKYQFYNNSNQLLSTNEYLYDEKGNLKLFNVYSGTGEQTAFYSYTYNDKGFKLTQHQETFSDGDVRDYRFEYEFDETGNYIKIIYIKDNKPVIYREREIKYYK
jgi:hypothetical protein